MYLSCSFGLLLITSFSSMSASDNEPSGPVYEDFRHLLASSQERMSTNRGPLGRLRIRVNKGLERVAGLLETRVALSIGGCVCLALVGISWVSLYHREQALSPVTDATDQEQAAMPADSPETSSPYHPISLDSAVRAATTGVLETAFFVRVGSFRDPYNAARLARTLRAQAFDVTTGALPGGLYVVELGPFPQRGAAEHAVQALRKDPGLSPQVVQRK
jgi:hypothetical protein